MSSMTDLGIESFSAAQYEQMLGEAAQGVGGEGLATGGTYGFVLLLREDGEAGAHSIQYPARLEAVLEQHGSGGVSTVDYRMLGETDLGSHVRQGRFKGNIWIPGDSEPLYTTGVLAVGGFLRGDGTGRVRTAPTPGRRPSITPHTRRRSSISPVALPEVPEGA